MNKNMYSNRKRLLRFSFYLLALQFIAFTTVIADNSSAQVKSLEETIISINVIDAKLDVVLNQIEGQTSYKFGFDRSLVEQVPLLSIKKSKISVKQVLVEISKLGRVSFRRVNNDIDVKPRAESTSGSSYEVIEDPRITGKVTDYTTGEPLPGVNILVEGTASGTVTDVDGNYVLNVSDDVSTLIFSFIGYVNEEVEISGRTVINVSMVPDIRSLEEVVVIGYGTAKKRDLTSAISQVSQEDIANRISPRLEQALQGQMSGVSVQQASGVPGNAPFVRVRGVGSVSSGNGPLYVIDGFPVEDSDIIGNLNMADVASIEVLKDAASAAIYGSRGSNGVILITTKKGKKGAPSITYNAYYGVQNPERLMDFMDANELGQMLTESRNFAWVQRDPVNNSASDPNDVRPSDFIINPEWTSGNLTNYDGQDYIFSKNAPVHNQAISVSGGTDKTNYFVSLDYFDQEGVVRGTGFERYSGRINLDTEVADWLKVGVNIAPSYSKQVDRNTEGKDNSINRIIWHVPFVPFDYRYDEEQGQIVSDYLDEWNSGNNNLGRFFLPFDRVPDERFKTQILANTFANFRLMEGLNFRTSIGLSTNFLDREIFTDKASGNGQATTQIWNGKSVNWLWENTINYDKSFGQHNLALLAGYSSQKDRSNSSYFRGIGHANDLSPTINNATAIDQWDQNVNEWALLSMIGRVTYNYAGKYFLSGSVRRDGSSRFGSENRWGTFSSVSGAWRISDEQFLADNDIISNLKLRASWGQTGNNRIGNYSAIATLQSANVALGANEALIPGLVPSRFENAELGWERTTTTNLGLDLGFFKDRVSLGLELYESITSDMLLNVPVPTTTGFNIALQNIGEVSNSGLEIDLETRNIANSSFQWTTRFNASWNKNEILKLGPNNEPIINGEFFAPLATNNSVGQPLGSFHLMVADGVFETQAEYDEAVAAGLIYNNERVGSVRFKDVNGDGEINNDDRVFAGQPYPVWNFGLTNEFFFKGFDLSIFINAAGGHHTYMATGRYYDSPHPLRMKGYLDNWNNRWRSEQDPGDGVTPTINYAGVRTSGDGVGNTRWLYKADWLRIKNITLGYTIPEKLTSRIGIGSLRIYATGDNLFLLTDYVGYNPEGVSTNFGESLTLSAGHDFGAYPLARSIVLGVNVNF